MFVLNTHPVAIGEWLERRHTNVRAIPPMVFLTGTLCLHVDDQPIMFYHIYENSATVNHTCIAYQRIRSRLFWILSFCTRMIPATDLPDLHRKFHHYFCTPVLFERFLTESESMIAIQLTVSTSSSSPLESGEGALSGDGASICGGGAGFTPRSWSSIILILWVSAASSAFPTSISFGGGSYHSRTWVPTKSVDQWGREFVPGSGCLQSLLSAMDLHCLHPESDW